MLRRVLIANRGEISVRIARGCRERGIATVAVYSDADRDAPHTRAADRAIRIGPAAARESYLNIAAILQAARDSGADAVHPGYGFLSENADFATACEDAGLTFIGPPARVIAQMGSKTAARATAVAAGVPVVPGIVPRDQSPQAVAEAVHAVGFPALIKAAAGGGGKGMRVVRSAEEVADAVEAASREAARAFADGTVYVERLIERPRHIEVQILGDMHGNVVHLFERDCSLQRRHQKVIEEAPADVLTPAVREGITAAAVAAARQVGYINAGTIEFILDGRGDDAQFYFLEMNTRLQVEHPVTELVTGIDLVHAQLRVANGERLWFSQEDVMRRGHAVECRVYAEDASRGLLPQAGRVLLYREPAGDGVRVDSGTAQGQTIGVDYDPMLAKLIVHADTRDAALAKMAGALRDFAILGVRHNVPFLIKLVGLDEVRRNDVDTGLIERRMDALAAAPSESLRAAAEAAAAVGHAAANGAAMPAAGAEHAAAMASSIRDPWETISW